MSSTRAQMAVVAISVSVLGLVVWLAARKVSLAGKTKTRTEEPHHRSEAQDAIPCDVLENPRWESKLGSLTELSLARCGLKEISPRIGACLKLVKLDLAGNDITTLPDALKKLGSLEILFISGARRLKKLPNVLAKMPSVTRLGLRSNGLEQITGDLPPFLEHLILTDNSIHTITPQGWAKMRTVRKLMLANNRLGAFDGGGDPARNLESLELLRLANNNLQILPPSILRLPKLAWIALAGNPALFFQQPEQEAADFKNTQKTKTDNRLPRVKWTDLDFGDNQQRLGSGASGVVRRATWRGEFVAVKKLQDRGSDGRAADEVATVDAVFGGADLTAKIPASVVRTKAVVEAGTDVESWGLVMELLPAGVRDLAKPPTIVEVTRDRYPDAERFAPRLALNILSDLCAALVCLHSRGVAHGDVYAHNTLVHDATATVKLGDLGAAFPYAGSPEPDLFQRVEVRAFGVLVSELNARLSYRIPLLQKRLTALAADCLNPDVDHRPLFADLQRRLDDLKAQVVPLTQS